MINFSAGARIWLVAGLTDMRCSFSGLASKVQNTLRDDPFSGHLFIFRERRGDMIKALWAHRDGLCMFTRRLERGHFVWPVTGHGKVHLTPAQLSMLLKGINWRHTQRTERICAKVDPWAPHNPMETPGSGRSFRSSRPPSAKWRSITACSHSGWQRTPAK